MATNDFTKRYLERRRELGLSSGQTTTQQTPGRTQITTPASANSNASKPASQGTARQESGNSYTSGYLAKRRELMGGGVTGGQTRPSATLPSIPSLSSSLRHFTPTQLLQDVLKQSETTRPAGGQTTTPAETMSSADMSARLDELRELRDTAEADRNEARTVLTGVNRYGTQAQREEWNSKLERAEADYSRYDQEYNELLDRYYQTENEEKRASLQQDEAMSGQYQSAQDIQADMDKVSAVMAYTVTHDGDAAQVEEYKQYLFDKYGLDQKAVDQYAISGAGGAYVPRTDGGYNNIYELYLELQEKKENAVSTLSEGGYDYERMTGYEDMLEDAAQYREDMGEWQEYAREHPILSSVDTLLTAPFQGFDFLRVMGQNIGHSDRDDPENYVPMNSYDMELTNYINAVRQTVSEEIEGATNWEIFDQNVAAFLYQTGMSIGDSSLNLLAFGPTGALVVGSSTAAANQAKDIIDRGGSKEQAFMGGMAAGAFEAIFEKVSIDNLLATKSVTGWKSWLKETAKQAGIEASEETFTEIANILADAAIMGDNSNYDVAVAEYVAQGMSQEDAERQAFFDLIGQVVQAGVGGAISGGVMGGAVNGVNGMANAAYNRYNQQLVRENDVKNAPILETNPQEGPVQSQNEGEIDSSIPEATRQAVEMLVRGEEISGNQAARIAESEEAVALLSQLTGEEVNTDAPISRVKSDIRALASREGRTSGEAGVNSQATGHGAQTQERPAAMQAYDVRRMEQAAQAGGFGESGRRALLAAYDGSVDAGSFYAGFAAYYEAGVSGMDMGRVRSEYAQDLTEAQRYAAYTAGQNDAAASLQREREGVQFATVYGDEAGFIPSEHSRNLSQDTVRFYNALGRATGTKITVTAATGEGGANGWYSNGTVYIAADAESAGSVVAKHEITHRLQEIAPEAYRTYRDYAVNAMAERDGSTATLVERYKARYAQSGVNLTTEQAMDEIAADFTEALTVDPSRFDTLAREHRSVARRVLDALRDFISKVKALFKGRSDQDRAAMSEYGVSMETLERAAQLWEEALRAGQAQVRGSVVGTEGGYARVDGKFSLKGVVEDNGTLLALHNLTEQNLRDALRLGGLPMPSIAIVQARQGHAKYGPISLVFGKASIDPQSNSDNRVYGGDAYTPTAPRVEYEASERVQTKLRQMYYDLEKRMGRDFADPLYPVGNYLEDEMNRKGGVSGILEGWRDNSKMMNIYLEETGQGAVEPIRYRRVDRLDDDTIRQYDFLLEHLGEDAVQDLRTQEHHAPMPRRIWMERHGEAMENAYRAYLLDYGMTSEQADNAMENGSLVNGVLAGLRRYLSKGAETVTEGVDTAATDDAIRAKVDKDAYNRWLDDLLDGAEKQVGIYNGRDLFTASGNPRSFSQLHYAYTLENIVRAMKENQDERGGQVWGVSAKTLQSVATPQYGSVQEIRDDSGRLGTVDDDTYTAQVTAIDEQISDIIQRVKQTNEAHSGNSFEESDIIGSVMLEAAKGKKTVDAIMRTFSREGYKISSQTAQDLQAIYRSAAELPTEYFEAKPRRAVGFDEVLAAVVPDNMDAMLRADAEQAGMRVLEYKSGNDADRLAKVNSVEGARFSLKSTDSWGRELSEEQRRYFQGSKITDADGRLLVLYHGTTAYGEITKFRRGRSGWLGPGIYLASRQADAQRYADAMGEGNGQLYELYANATNPLVVTEGNPVPEILRAAYGRDSVYRSRSAKQGNDAQIITTADIKKLQSKGYDGIRWDFGGSTEVSVFSPEQIKRVDNLTPSGSQDVRYSLKAEDSQGRELTQEQQEFFRDSKAVDNQGRLLVLYHGTASNFTVFDRERITQNYPNNIGDLGFYFTPYQTDARGYAGNAAGRVGGGSVMQVYLNLTNPLVVEDDGWGGAANQADARHSELLRWARAGGHDGIIVRSTDFEMEDGEYDAIYVAFSPEQIKNTDNLTPTSDPDIRRSIKGGDILRQNAALQEENSLLRERVEYWRGQTRRTERVTTDKKAVERAARELIRAYNSSLETAEIAGDLQSLYDYIASGRDGSDELTYTEARRRSDAIARKLVDSAAVLEDDAYRDYADLRSYLRSTPLSISAEDSHDIADFGDFRRRNFGRMTIRSGPTNIDQVYQEMSGMWPEFFDETRESTPSDQLVHIAEVLDGIYRVTERNPFSGYFDAAVTDASNEIMERFFDLPQTRPTFADRQARKLDDAKAAGRRRLAEQRERSDARLNELRQQNRERVQRAIQRERETRARQIDRLKTRYAARDAAGRERRSARELRARISRHVADLSRRLLRPSDKQHIPEQLRTAVAAMLDAINLESVYTVDPETGRRRKGGNGDPTKRTEAFRALRQAYANITKDGADYTLIIDPDLMDNLTELEAMRDTPLAEMGTAQLSTIWATVRAVEASIRTANRMLGESRFRTISQVAEGIRSDNIMRQDRGDYRGILGKVDRLVNLDMLTPQGYFHRMGPTGDALFRMLRSAQDRHIEIMRSAQEATRDIIGSVDTTQLERETHTFDVDGQKLTMSTAQIMALYELMKRQQAQEHIFTGGIRPEAVRTGRGLRENRRADAVHVTVEDLAEITGVLTEEQVKIADALQKYMGGQLAELGNQASMEVYGYRKFTEPNYFPIQVDRNQTQRDIAKEAQAQTIAGRGFTKGTVPRANNAVMVGSIFDIFASHVNDMATYSAWLPTMENVRRIRDFTFRDSEGNRTGTVKSVIERVFGRNGNAYLNKLVDDLNQGVRTAGSGNFMDSIVGNYKAAAVAANLRVIAQQPTAILRALNTMDAKYLLAGTVRRGDWEKVMKYAPIARWKDWGYFDINTGRQMKDVLLGSSTRLEKLRQAGMAGAGKADSIAWARLWNAVEAETKDRRPGLKPGTDAFYRAVGDRFSEIVDQTQVVDGILQRSQIMRSSDALTKISTSFMGEPTKSYNMFVNAVYDLRHATSQQGRSRAKRALARTTTALAVSFTVNAIMQSLVDALRDDDKETDYWEKVFQAFTGFTGDEETVLDYWNSFWSGNLEASYNPLAYMPYFKDLVSIAQGYDVTRMDMEAIEKVWSAFTNMRSALSGEGRYSIAGASANMLAEVARLFGLPVANIKRDVQAAATTAAIETDNYLMQYRMDKALLNIGYQGNRSGFMDILYAASVNDPEAYEIIYEDMVASGITEDQIRTAMESRMKEDQGVESVDELSRRYLTPNQERTYDRLYGQVSSSPVWRAASLEQREAVEEDIYDLTTGTDAGVKLQEKIDGGAAYGITEADYLLYLAAREIADGENEDPEKRNGSIDQAEAQAAIDMLTGLSDEGRAYLWQSTNKGWSEEKNPYR